MIATTPRQQLQTMLEDSLYRPACKCCNFPLAPHQLETGLCALCTLKLKALSEGRPDWDFMAGDVEGYRG